MNDNGSTVSCIPCAIVVAAIYRVFGISNYSSHTAASIIGKKEGEFFSSSSMPSSRQTRPLSLCSEPDYSLVGHLSNKACCVIQCT